MEHALAHSQLSPAPSGSTARQGRSILHDIVVEHGPPRLLGELFLTAATAAERCGVTLEFATLRELVEANRANVDNWPHIVTLYDETLCPVTNPDDTFAILGRDASGDVVTANAGRFYDWTATSIAEELRSLRLFYAEPDSMRQPGETFYLPSDDASCIRGRVAYVGAAWVRPSHRGLGLSAILPRLAKGYALTRWQPEWITSLMSASNFGRGLNSKFGYPHADTSGRWTNSLQGNLGCSILWMSRDELVDDIAEALGRLRPESGAGSLGGEAQQTDARTGRAA